MKKLLIILPFLSIMGLYSQTTIAVLEHEAKGVAEVEASALTDRLRIELFKTGLFTVVERGMMEEILHEQGFQQTGCTSDECIVEVGRLVGVEQIVGGSISKVGELYSINSRIVSVESSKIINIATYDYESKISDLMRYGMRNVARKLAGLKVEETVRQQPVSAKRPTQTSSIS